MPSPITDSPPPDRRHVGRRRHAGGGLVATSWHAPGASGSMGMSAPHRSSTSQAMHSCLYPHHEHCIPGAGWKRPSAIPSTAALSMATARSFRPSSAGGTLTLMTCGAFVLTRIHQVQGRRRLARGRLDQELVADKLQLVLEGGLLRVGPRGGGLEVHRAEVGQHQVDGARQRHRQPRYRFGEVDLHADGFAVECLRALQVGAHHAQPGVEGFLPLGRVVELHRPLLALQGGECLPERGLGGLGGVVATAPPGEVERLQGGVDRLAQVQARGGGLLDLQPRARSRT